jgi:hypothetical protein
VKNKVAVLRRAKAVPPVDAITAESEQRLHLRAHNYWATIHKIGDAPLWRDFDPLMVDDRCTQSFVLEVGETGSSTLVRDIGPALRAESGVFEDVIDLRDAPPGSLLMRISTFLPELINRAVPLSVEAPFETGDGRPGIYRGLLMPFTLNGDTIDIVFGVVSWRELTSLDGALPDVPSAKIIAIK